TFAPIVPKSLTIDCRVSLSNLGATNRLPCAFFFTKFGTLIFKVSADDLNFSYSPSFTLKLICFGSLRLGLRFSPTDKSLAKLLSCSLIQSHHVSSKFITIYVCRLYDNQQNIK